MLTQNLQGAWGIYFKLISEYGVLAALQATLISVALHHLIPIPPLLIPDRKDGDAIKTHPGVMMPIPLLLIPDRKYGVAIKTHPGVMMPIPPFLIPDRKDGDAIKTHPGVMNFHQEAPA